jgi:ribosome recycling factor
MVSVPIPKASKEKREDMVKLAKKAGEKVCTCMVDK